MINQQEYTNMIIMAFQGKESGARKKAEELLIQTCQNDVRSIDILCELSTQQNDQLLAEQAAITIITAVKKFIANTKPYVVEMRLHHVDLFVQMLSKQISDKIKSSIQQALQQLVCYDKQNHFKTQLKQHIIQSIESRLENMVVSAFFIAETLQLDTQWEWFQSIIKAGKIIDSFSQSTKVLWAKVLFNQLNKQFTTYQISFVPEPIQQYFIYNEELCQVLILKTQQLTFVGEDLDYCHFVVASQRLIYDSILKQFKDAIIAKKCPFLDIICILSDAYIQSLVAFTMSQNFQKDNINQNQSNLINEIIKFLAISCKSIQVYHIFAEYRMAIFIDIILPFFSSTQKEINDLIDDPNEFVQLTQDILDEQKSDIIKSSIAQLIIAYCQQIDGSISFFTSFSILAASYCIQKVQNTEIKEQLGLIMELKEHYFLKSMNINLLLESSLLILSIVSNYLTQRNEVGLIFKSFINEYGDYLLNYSIPLVKARLCTFIGSFCKTILHEKEEFSYSLLKFLMNQIQSQKNDQFANCYCAIEAIKNIIEEPSLEKVLESSIGQILLVLCESLLQSDFEVHFETIKQIYKTFKLEASILDQSLGLIVLKIQKEQQLLEQGQTERQILINQTWNILKALPEIENIIPVHFNLLEKRVSVLYKYIINPNIIDFDEDIVYFISQLIFKTKFISDYQAEMLFQCNKVIEKQKFTLGQLFELFNYYIYYGKTLFQNIKAQEFLIQILESVFNNPHRGEASQGEAILLIHLLIQEYQLSQEVLAYIYTKILQRSQFEVKNDFLRARLMGVYISGFIQNCPQTLAWIEQQQGFIYDHIIDSSKHCQPDYDSQLYVYGFCQLLFKNPQHLNITLLQNFVSVLKKQYHHDLKKAKDDNNDSEDMFAFNDELEDAKITMETFLCNINKYNEFDQFHLTYQQIRKTINIPELIQNDPILKKDLDELLKINKFNQESRIILKLKKRKQP
ncbi:unnamed protein product [Paramecium sonneborni]|uniref:Importin N-terminal domain-containing protein n=1 Tax=Paramecium sonneborni TaxID=65129 RepID=A0A8S1NW03_9CILI|nr:unnamed protein product [Paramecium sonneborni]